MNTDSTKVVVSLSEIGEVKNVTHLVFTEELREEFLNAFGFESDTQETFREVQDFVESHDEGDEIDLGELCYLLSEYSMSAGHPAHVAKEFLKKVNAV